MEEQKNNSILAHFIFESVINGKDWFQNFLGSGEKKSKMAISFCCREFFDR